MEMQAEDAVSIFEFIMKSPFRYWKEGCTAFPGMSSGEHTGGAVAVVVSEQLDGGDGDRGCRGGNDRDKDFFVHF